MPFWLECYMSSCCRSSIPTATASVGRRFQVSDQKLADVHGIVIGHVEVVEVKIRRKRLVASGPQSRNLMIQ